jgi:hypothetical protein
LCSRNVRSETLTTVMPSTASTAVTMRAPCSASVQATVTSRTTACSSTRTRSIAPRMPPASPIAVATRANDPGCCGMTRRMVWL